MTARRSAAALVRGAWTRFRCARAEPGTGSLDAGALIHEVEPGLDDIEFAEVTGEDRATFVEHAVIWQIRRALGAGQFDIALDLQRYGVRRIAELTDAAVAKPRLTIVPPRISVPT